MKVKCTHYEEVQDKNNPKEFFKPNKEYDVTAERGKELIESGYFELVDTDENVVLDYSKGETPKVIIGEEANKRVAKSNKNK